MNVRLLDPALMELDEAAAWYAAQSPGLERRFLAEMDIARSHILDWPHAWHPLDHGLRRYRLKMFPYGVIYAVRETEIIVVAIADLHREPEYWRDRLKKV